ncbi:glutathione S-transferase family protein [Bradyrhizobium embrapense]|uniref:glutathione S-transferase family protein n=1 Tax=Bradyrhizobium embrapense TaxID=630921 RepID=UPI00067A88DA|nr:glutathione S-transferase [Bradyrhizobium embrapense]
MKLYQSSASPNSRRVRIYLAEKGITMPLVPVDLASREQFSDAYAAINPRRVVPALMLDDGTAIAEVPAIIRYLEETHPNPPLLGGSPKEKATVTMWERRMELEGFAPVMEAVRNGAPGLKGRAIAGPHGYDQIPELVVRGHRRIADFYGDLEARLSETAFVAGDTFSIADITAIVAIDFAGKALGLSTPEKHGPTRRWYNSIASRPSMTA